MASNKKPNDPNTYTPVYVDPVEDNPVGTYSESKYAFMFDSMAKDVTNEKTDNKQQSKGKTLPKTEIHPIIEKPAKIQKTGTNKTKVDNSKKNLNTKPKPTSSYQRIRDQKYSKPTIPSPKKPTTSYGYNRVQNTGKSNTKKDDITRKSFRHPESDVKDNFVYEKRRFVENNISSHKNSISNSQQKVSEDSIPVPTNTLNKNLFQNGDFDKVNVKAESKMQDNNATNSGKKSFRKNEDPVQKKVVETNLSPKKEEVQNVSASKKEDDKPKTTKSKKFIPKKWARY